MFYDVSIAFLFEIGNAERRRRRRRERRLDNRCQPGKQNPCTEIRPWLKLLVDDKLPVELIFEEVGPVPLIWCLWHLLGGGARWAIISFAKCARVSLLWWCRKSLLAIILCFYLETNCHFKRTYNFTTCSTIVQIITPLHYFLVGELFIKDSTSNSNSPLITKNNCWEISFMYFFCFSLYCLYIKMVVWMLSRL